MLYNYEINGVFIGREAYIKNGQMYEVDTSKELIMDYFLLDIPRKEITILHGGSDAFKQAFEEEVKDKRIRVSTDPNDKESAGEFLIIKE